MRIVYGSVLSGLLAFSAFAIGVMPFMLDIAPILALGFGVVAIIAHAWKNKIINRFNRVNILLGVFGVFYLWVAGYMLLALRDISVIWVYALVLILIGIDVGAYFMGRLLGGPKIWVALSPKKTWAGMLGAVVGSAGVMAFPFDVIIGDVYVGSIMNLMQIDWAVMVSLAVVFSVVAQSGDFLESWLKRRVGVKDSSHLIPGHGGVLDRMDGYLSLLLFLAFFAF